MSIINGTYYNSDINLTAGQITTVIAEWQETYEEMILKKLLGYDLYTLYVADLALATVGSPTAQRFIDLVDGKAFSFDVNGNTVSTEWKGFRDSTIKKSLIGKDKNISICLHKRSTYNGKRTSKRYTKDIRKIYSTKTYCTKRQ